MNTSISMDMQRRTVTGKKVKQLRKQGILPATVYGKGIEPVSVQIDERTFETIYHQAGRSSLITLSLPEQKPQAAFIQDVQRHPVTRAILHADLRVVNLSETIYSEVPVILIGKSPLAERGDAIIYHGLSIIEVHALPADVPHQIEVDVSHLDNLDTSITVGDLPASATYTIVSPAESVIVALSPTRKSAEEEGTIQESSSLEPALIRKERDHNE